METNTLGFHVYISYIRNLHCVCIYTIGLFWIPSATRINPTEDPSWLQWNCNFFESYAPFEQASLAPGGKDLSIYLQQSQELLSFRIIWFGAAQFISKKQFSGELLSHSITFLALQNLTNFIDFLRSEILRHGSGVWIVAVTYKMASH